jgi:GMP synthase (glutamine-hydrolysing)
MSHGDQVKTIPSGFITIANTGTCKHAAMANIKRKLYAVQFHPEVKHTINGKKLISNFIFNICNVKSD